MLFTIKFVINSCEVSQSAWYCRERYFADSTIYVGFRTTIKMIGTSTNAFAYFVVWSLSFGSRTPENKHLKSAQMSTQMKSLKAGCRSDVENWT